MLFSIVVPVYNVEKYLDECINSIIEQSKAIDNDLEVLLIDDGSIDNSGSICDSYENKYPDLIRVFHKENQGLLATRRYGFKKASGEYIVNCDSDDLLEPGMLLKLKNVINKYTEPDVILFNYNYMVGDSKKIAYKNIFSVEPEIRVDKESVLETFLKDHSVVSLCTKIYKRSCIDVDKDYSSFYKVSNGEDSLQSIELYNKAESFIYMNDALYNYRIGSGMTRRFDKNYYIGFKAVLEQIRNQKNSWKICDFEKLFAVKVMQTVGRAITQSRYGVWKSYTQQREYFTNIRKDEMVDNALSYLKSIKGYLQTDHYYLLTLLKFRLYFSICMLLHIKNTLGKIGRGKGK